MSTRCAAMLCVIPAAERVQIKHTQGVFQRHLVKPSNHLRLPLGARWSPAHTGGIGRLTRLGQLSGQPDLRSP